MTGSFPVFTEDLSRYLLFGGSLLLIVFSGKNLYCGYICPFGAFQELENKAAKLPQLKISSKIKQTASLTAPFLAWFALVTGLSTGNTAASSFEPFSLLFGFVGEGSFKNVAISQSNLITETIYLKQLVDDVATSILMGHNKKITFENNISSEIHLETISGYITQIFTNLIQNSLIHGFYNFENGKIALNCQLISHEIIIDYSDNGNGIPEKISREIFNPYFTSARERGGSGLGLHIIQTIIHSYLGGSINLIENEDPGVLFRIILPI